MTPSCFWMCSKKRISNLLLGDDACIMQISSVDFACVCVFTCDEYDAFGQTIAGQWTCWMKVLNLSRNSPYRIRNLMLAALFGV